MPKALYICGVHLVRTREVSKVLLGHLVQSDTEEQGPTLHSETNWGSNGSGKWVTSFVSPLSEI